MAVFLDEEDVWKCPKHPSKRRRHGICSTCLRDRLISLCPDCGNVRPCSCCSASSSSSASSSFKFFSSASSSRRAGGGGRVSELIDREPAFQRSRSVGIPFLFSRFAREKQAENSSRKSKPSSFWSRILLSRKSKSVTERRDGGGCNTIEENECRNSCSSASIEEFASMMSRSRSVSVTAAKGGRGWSFSSPLSVFRQPSAKAAKVANDRSPMCRG